MNSHSLDTHFELLFPVRGLLNLLTVAHHSSVLATRAGDLSVTKIRVETTEQQLSISNISIHLKQAKRQEENFHLHLLSAHTNGYLSVKISLV